MFDTLTVRGYRYNLVSFGYVAPLLGHTGPTPKRVDALALRDHGLAGGEIQLELTGSNRAAADGGCWYGAKCDIDPSAPDGELGRLRLRRMGADGELISEKNLVLDELDDSHLLDRLVSETLHWHAEAFGTGPFEAPAEPARQKQAVRRRR